MAVSVEQKYETLVRAAPDAIFLIDADTGRIVEVNEEAVTMLGYTRQRLEGMSVTDLHPDENVADYRETFEETIAEGEAQFSELPGGEQAYVLDSDGERIPIEVRSRVVSVEEGRFVYSIIRDISDLREQERRAERLAEELALVNRLVRHDIRNDMAVILGWLQKLDETLGDAHAEALELLVRRSRAVVELTDTVRDYVDVLQTDDDPELEAIRIDDVVEEVAVATRQAYEEATITVGDLPAVSVRAMPMLTSVFRNLLHNAVQHNDSDEPVVEVTATEGDGTVVVRVADNGPGIPDDRKAEVFGKDDRGLDSSGTGIGLYLVDELVDQFGGTVRVEDNTPRGAVFSVELQRAPESE